MATRRYNQRTWPVGLQPGPVLDGLPREVDGVMIDLTRDGWPGTQESTICRLFVDYRLPGSNYWRCLCAGAGLPGGDFTRPGSDVIETESRLHLVWPEIMTMRLRPSAVRVVMDVILPLVAAIRIETFRLV